MSEQQAQYGQATHDSAPLGSHLRRVADWQERVYRLSDEPDFPEDWPQIRQAVLQRDGYTCVRCAAKFKKPELSVHHIVPREEGGGDHNANLVTLCHKCHDHVEVNELRTIVDIIGSYEENDTQEGDDEPKKLPKSKEADPDDWHTWVYGGQRNPNL